VRGPEPRQSHGSRSEPGSRRRGGGTSLAEPGGGPSLTPPPYATARAVVWSRAMEDREEVAQEAYVGSERQRIAELERFLRIDALPAQKDERPRQASAIDEASVTKPRSNARDMSGTTS
jgi:hypothetical protein